MLNHARPRDNHHLGISVIWQELFFENFFHMGNNPIV